MKVAILIAPRDFKDESLTHLQLLFGKKDVESRVAGLSLKNCTGYHGAVVKPQVEFAELQPSEYDVLLLMDGPGVDSLRLYEHRPLLDLIRVFHESNKVIVGIGNGIKAVAKANIVKDTKIAKTDDETEKIVRLYRGVVTEDFVVSDKKIITVSGTDNIGDFVNVLVGGARYTF